MTDPKASAKSPRPLTARERKRAITNFEAERKRERDAGLALLDARRKEEERRRVLQQVIEMWPLWLGMVVGMFGPAIAFVAQAFGPWCMTLVFPFVALAQRPEIQVGPITRLLPNLMLYIQFPIEGWLAYIVLRHRVKPLSVVWQVALFHFLGLAELWMLTGTAFDFLRR